MCFLLRCAGTQEIVGVFYFLRDELIQLDSAVGEGGQEAVDGQLQQGDVGADQGEVMGRKLWKK